MKEIHCTVRQFVRVRWARRIEIEVRNNVNGLVRLRVYMVTWEGAVVPNIFNLNNFI